MHKSPSRKTKKILIFFLLIMPLILLIGISFNNQHKEAKYHKISYNDFIKMVNDKKVSLVSYSKDNSKLTFKGTDEKIYITDNPRTMDFKKFLLENNVKVNEINTASTKLFISLAFDLIRFTIIVFVLIYISNTLTSKMAKNTEVLLSTIPDVKFKDLAGSSEVKEEIQFIIDFLKKPQKYISRGAKLPKGIIFYGPPGTGKTLTAKAIAGEAGVPFFNISGSDFVEMYVGLGAKRVRELFSQARKKSPCIIFIDEIDAVGKKRGIDSNGERDQTINALLSEIDGFVGSEGIIVIAATNRIEDLDSALIRPGRFDKHIAMPLPDLNDRTEILRRHIDNKEIACDVILDDIAKLTMGFSGAGIESLINEATIISVTKNKQKIDIEDIDDAYYKIVMKGHKKRNKTKCSDERELIAWHEAGHALVSKLLTNNSIPKVTIVPSTSGAGGVTFITPKKAGLHSKEDILNDIKVCYGGRIGEFLLLKDVNKITTGANNDIQQATSKIKNFVNYFGMSESFGLLNLEILEVDNKILLNESLKISTQCYNQTLQLLKDNIITLKEIAETLLEKESISEDILDSIIYDNKVNKKQ